MMLTYQTIPLSTGLKCEVIHIPSANRYSRGAVVLLHGFPDMHWGWRHLFRPISNLGYDVYAPMMRGYNLTDKEICSKNEDLSEEVICEDILALLDALQIDKAVVAGHDWGGCIAWSFASKYPTRTSGIASFCTPYSLWEFIKKNEHRYAYQKVFRTEEAVLALEENIERSVRILFRGIVDEPIENTEDAMLLAKVLGLKKQTKNVEKKTTLTKMMSEADFKIYVQRFKAIGFRNPLRYYKNTDVNFDWETKIKQTTLKVPALMVTADQDYVLPASSTYGMEKQVDNLQIVHIKGSGHWILQEQPEKCAKAICSWLASLDSFNYPYSDPFYQSRI